jgi:hypothetical protein
MKSEIFEPLAFSPPLAPGNQGPYFEMRTYVLKPGGIPSMAQRWGSSVSTTALSSCPIRQVPQG